MALVLQQGNDQQLDPRREHNSVPPATIQNAKINKLINNINTVHGVEQNLVVSARKDNLSQITIQEFLEVTDILLHNHHAFTEKRMIPKLTKNLNIESIASLLDSLQGAYSETMTNDKDREALFEEKKNAIQQKIGFLYNKGLIHNRLLFGLFLVMNYEKHIPELAAGQMNKFHAGRFWQDINNRLFLDENKEQFWGKATTLGAEQVHHQTTKALHNSLH